MSDSECSYVTHELDVRKLGTVEMIVFADGAGSALVKGEPVDGCLVRIQSACQYGEIYGSTECDCRAQLDMSIKQIQEDGNGIIVHLLKQEGRGAGLVMKACAYKLKRDKNIDSFTAYQNLNVELDSRDYAAAADVLTSIGLKRVTLLTNNPEKIDALRAAGLTVERRPLITLKRTKKCSEYLSSKLLQGHLFADDAESIAFD